jgi:Flp pilus assembly protein TadG
MRSCRFLSNLAKCAQNFGASDCGNVAVIFSIALIPIFSAVGAAVDFSHANSVRASLQSATDSTALMLSRDGATNNDATVNDSAGEILKANFKNKGANISAVNVVQDNSNGLAVTVSATATLKPTFMSAFGFGSYELAAKSKVRRGESRLRVALVLDVTGSMSSANKIGALKTASKNLIVQLQNASTKGGDVYVSIIPFSKDVGVEAINFSAEWIRWDLWESENGSCSKAKHKSAMACTADKGKWTPANRNTWNGCITDRDQDYDTENTPPEKQTYGTLFPAEQYSYCPVPMMGLSNDWTALKAKIDSFQPNGNTNQAIGLQWGFQSLTSGPFAIPAKDRNYNYKDYIILLSDGLNTENRWYSSQSPINSRQKITCDNVKNAGITLYTVQVNTVGDPKSTLLESCASAPSKFSLLTSASQIIETFDSIGTEISNLRIAE